MSNDFAPLFKTRNGCGEQHAQVYLKGLLSQVPGKNMERMAEVLPKTKQQDLQQFVSDSPWDERAVWNVVAARVDAQLGGKEDSMLAGDESCFAKQGKKSVGVARQHNGRLGKTDNCQVGVFTAMVQDGQAALVGCRLFLPDEWVSDPNRALAAGVPKEEIRARSKIELFKELIAQAIEQGLRFKLVGCDSFYGRDQGLLVHIAQLGRVFVADIPRDTRLWTSRPNGETRPQSLAASGAQRAEQIKPVQTRQMVVRDGENGPVRVKAGARRVWFWPPQGGEPMSCWLLVTEHADGTCKFTLINAPANTELEKLVGWQGQRFFIEQTFKNGKSHAGMADYQVRKWRGWQHHMALVGMALLFMLEERRLQRKEWSQLSAADITELLHWQFTTRPSREAVIERIVQRHRRRAKATASKRSVDSRRRPTRAKKI